MYNLNENAFKPRIYFANKIWKLIKRDSNKLTVKPYEKLLFDGCLQYCRYLAGHRLDKRKDKYKTQREKAIAYISDKVILNKSGRLLVKSNTEFVAYSWLCARVRNIKIEGLRSLI